MKSLFSKSILLVCLVTGLPGLFFACKKDSGFHFDEITIAADKPIEEEYRLLHVSQIGRIEGDSLWLGLGMYACFFYMDMSAPNSAEAYKALEWSRDNFRPLQIRFFKETSLIANIKMPTQEETKKYLSGWVKP
ncbi:MAG: hypothetical protein QM727_10200 [Niabella sp.]